ncbi:hypothetical protein A9Q93_11310 [Nonlabens dokdonensis]|uniref:C1q domain-containing protein n=1 Tax=Nonlabens dokdonensis TaxID=328515 RepID=A0A1Z8AM49_9FLAO|nr:hypothetical protein [Nonlabens dokdonensis]OUS11424.1 hypothetical protein A9Q93_11310 [Nonlabens dokdonensis]
MKISLITFLLILGNLFFVNGQVAIGTDTPATGAALTIEDPTGTSGVLFPKVNIVDLSTVAPLPTGTQEGTIVYNTNITTGTGYYFFKNNRWEPIFGVVGGMAKFRNTVFGSTSNNFNINTVGRDAQIFGNVYFNDNATVYHVANNTTLEVRETGRYKIVINLSFEAASTNTVARLLAVEGRLQINGTNEGGIYRSQEMSSANSTSPDYGSITITEIVNLNAFDDLTVRVSQTQDAGRVNLRSINTSSFFIERLD